jgi:hypothetical protein
MRMQWLLAWLMVVGLTACALPHEPVPEVVPSGPSPIEQEVTALRQELALLRQEVTMLGGRVTSFDPWTARIMQLETLLATSPLKKKPGSVRPGREPTPLQLVALAQRDARVEPSARGYFGNSGEMTYTWQPGRIYMVYLTATQPTLIALPPGETVAMGLMLDKDAYDVTTKTVGLDLTAYSALSVRPLFDKGEVDAFVLSTGGRRYLFHFVISNDAKAMTVVTFETPAVVREPQQELPRITPRPPS